MTISLSDSVLRLLVDQLTAEQLRHIAAAKDAERPDRQARRSLSPAAVDELAEMLNAGRTPTIGWWRRHARTAQVTAMR